MPGGPAILWFHRVHQADDVLLRLCCLTFRGLLLSVLLRKVPADHATTDRTNDSVVPRVMPSAPLRAVHVLQNLCMADDMLGIRGARGNALLNQKIAPSRSLGLPRTTGHAVTLRLVNLCAGEFRVARSRTRRRHYAHCRAFS